jgi:hypothetical protein
MASVRLVASMFFAAARWKPRVIKEITPAGDVHARLRWWFRGQRNIEALNPSVFRDDFEVPKEPNDEDLEKCRLRAERHLFREFNDYASSLVDPKVSEHEMYFIQRHYGMPSRLLDWSLDPLIGLYFATEKKDEKSTTNGCVFLVDAYQIVYSQEPRTKDWGIGTLKHPDVKAALAAIAWDEKNGLIPQFHFPVQVAKRDVRIINQAGCFTFHVKRAPNLPEKAFLEQVIEIPASAKEGIREELKILQFHPLRVYGDLNSLSKTVTERVMSK